MPTTSNCPLLQKSDDRLQKTNTRISSFGLDDSPANAIIVTACLFNTGRESAFWTLKLEHRAGSTVVFETEPAGRQLTDLLVIMVVEDDPQVQALVEEALTDGSFAATVTSSGEEAITLIKGNRSNYCALVLNINLPGRMNGWDVARQARELDPEFPVVYMTDAAADAWASRGCQTASFGGLVPNFVILQSSAQRLRLAPRNFKVALLLQ